MQKLKVDFDDFANEEDSARLALNCAITAYHLHEWVWGDWLKTDYAVWKKLGIRDKESFVAWLERECPGFNTLQEPGQWREAFCTSARLWNTARRRFRNGTLSGTHLLSPIRLRPRSVSALRCLLFAAPRSN